MTGLTVTGHNKHKLTWQTFFSFVRQIKKRSRLSLFQLASPLRLHSLLLVMDRVPSRRLSTYTLGLWDCLPKSSFPGSFCALCYHASQIVPIDFTSQICEQSTKSPVRLAVFVATNLN